MDNHATSRLNMGEARAGDLTELTLTGREFDLLFSTGWVRTTNDRLGVLIDDYEDEQVEGQHNLLALVMLSERFAETTREGIFSRLADLAALAAQRKTAIHFYF